jgi:hypothetical protein
VTAGKVQIFTTAVAFILPRERFLFNQQENPPQDNLSLQPFCFLWFDYSQQHGT